jgi:sulfide dehydrogenase cytochrome subunit
MICRELSGVVFRQPVRPNSEEAYMTRLVKYLLAGIWMVIVSGSVIAAPVTIETCAECHGTDGMGLGNPMVPVIAGMPAGHIEEAIYAYIDGARSCLREPQMCATVAALSEEQVSEFAEYFSAKVRDASGEEYNEDLAAEGAVLHQTHCATCHRPPDDENVEFAVGIPLHGQRSEYLRYAIEAYFHGDREALLDTMATEIGKLEPGDLGALVNFYSSYRASD